VDADGETIHLYADHNRWGPFGTVIAHLSLVVVLFGALIGTTLGYRNEGVAVAVGSTVEIGDGSGLSVEARRFSDSYYADGSPSDYASDLAVYRDGQEVAASTIRVNEPLRVDGYAFYQSYFGAAAAMRVADQTGAVLYDRGVPLEWSSKDGIHVVGQIVLPEANRTAYVIAPASGEVDPDIKPGQIRVEVYETGSEGMPLAATVLTQGEATDVGGLEMTFVRERQFTGLIVAKDPGVPFIWLGCFFLVAGTAMVFFFPSRRVWALVRGTEGGSALHVGAVIRHDVGFEAEFTRVSQEIDAALAASAKHG
jgi:cytochrome c biogenesis protein